MFLLDIASTFFKISRPDIQEFLVSEGFQAPTIPPFETNHKKNQRILLVNNAALDYKKNIRTIKLSPQTAVGSLHNRLIMGMIEEITFKNYRPGKDISIQERQPHGGRSTGVIC